MSRLITKASSKKERIAFLIHLASGKGCDSRGCTTVEGQCFLVDKNHNEGVEKLAKDMLREML
jgi:hypothetical protein